jgi:hypothetical protein
MLDLIIAKALAKSADDRYAGIAELAADLRACRQQGLGGIVPSLIAAAQPVVAESQKMLFDDTTLPAARAEDRSLPGDTIPSRGLAKEFDSMAATMRLAIKTGALTDPDAFAANFGVSRHSIDAAIMDAGDESDRNWGANTVMRAPPWSLRDRQIFLGTIGAALVLGVLIVFV